MKLAKGVCTCFVIWIMSPFNITGYGTRKIKKTIVFSCEISSYTLTPAPPPPSYRMLLTTVLSPLWELLLYLYIWQWSWGMEWIPTTARKLFLLYSFLSHAPRWSIEVLPGGPPVRHLCHEADLGQTLHSVCLQQVHHLWCGHLRSGATGLSQGTEYTHAINFKKKLDIASIFKEQCHKRYIFSCIRFLFFPFAF